MSDSRKPSKAACLCAEPVIGGLPSQPASTSGIGTQPGLDQGLNTHPAAPTFQQQDGTLPSTQLISLSANETLGRRRRMMTTCAAAAFSGPPAQDYGVCGGTGSSCPLADKCAAVLHDERPAPVHVPPSAAVHGLLQVLSHACSMHVLPCLSTSMPTERGFGLDASEHCACLAAVLKPGHGRPRH